MNNDNIFDIVYSELDEVINNMKENVNNFDNSKNSIEDMIIKEEYGSN